MVVTNCCLNFIFDLSTGKRRVIAAKPGDAEVAVALQNLVQAA